MSGRILIVHDQEERRQQMKESLEPMHKVIIREDIATAMTFLREQERRLNDTPIDLIISAVHLDSGDELSVFDFLKWSQGNPQLKPVPFILLCSEPSRVARFVKDAVRNAGQALGAAGYIIMDTFDAKSFLCELETYLPEHLRSIAESDSDEAAYPKSENV
jgi:CheY-like chemotaxis protein